MKEYNDLKEIFAMAGVCFAGLMLLICIHKVSGGKMFGRVGTLLGRIEADYNPRSLDTVKVNSKEFYKILDEIKQPYSAKIAVHEGKILGKGIGNSTQKYKVDNIYGDYMYSFIVEEYGLMGGIIILILYISLLARSSIIARMCENEFEKYAIGGLAVLISGQAFMHILVNVDIGPMTGQTLPLISHGSSAFVVFCIAFGIILSISRLAKKKIANFETLTEQSRNDIEANKQAAEKSE